MTRPFVILVFLSLATNSLAQQDFYSECLSSPRSTALGQSVLPDAGSVLDAAINPAALARLKFANVGFLYSPFKNVSGENIAIGVGLPMHDNAGIGLMYFRNKRGISLRDKNGGLNDKLATSAAILASFARTFFQDKLSVGLGLKVTMFDFITPISTAVGLNFGVGYKFANNSPLLKNTQIGCAIANLTTPFYDNVDGGKAPNTRHPRRISVFFFKPVDLSTLRLNMTGAVSHFETDDAVRFHGGMEAVVASIFSLRAGFFSDQYMLGAAVDCRHVLFEYAYHSSSFSNAFYFSPYQHIISASFHL